MPLSKFIPDNVKSAYIESVCELAVDDAIEAMSEKQVCEMYAKSVIRAPVQLGVQIMS